MMNQILQNLKKAGGAIALLVLFIYSGNLKAATITSAATGNWNATTTWVGGVAPTAADDVIIANGHTVTVTANASCISITFNGASATLTVNSGITLTMSGTLTLQSAAAASRAATVSGDGTITGCTGINAGTTVTPSANHTTAITSSIATFNVSGGLNINSNRSGSTNNNSTFTLSSGTVAISGGVTTTNVGNCTSTLTLGNSSPTLRIGGATPFTVSGTGTSTFTLNGTGATVEYSSNSSLTFLAAPAGLLSYTNLIISGGAGTKTLAANTTVSGALTVRAGTTLGLSTFTLGSPTSVLLETVGGGNGAAITGTGALTLGGNITVNYSGTGAITTGATILSPVNLGATRTITVADDGTANSDLTMSGVISGTGFGITKDGAGTLTLSGANTYTGTTTVNAGTLQLGAAGVIADGSNVTLNGGTLRTGATTGNSETVGTLTLSSNSTIALGSGDHSLNFSASDLITWSGSLTITGWIGTEGATGSEGKIFFGADNTGLTTTQLSAITFTGYTGTPVLLSSGELVPPSSCTDPSIITQPSGTSVCKDATSPVLSVTATGTNLTYQWYSNNTNTTTGSTEINSATSSTYSAPTSNIGTMYYYVIISGDCGSPVTSSIVAVTVDPTSVGGTAAAAASPLCTGSSTSVSVTGFTGTIQWQQSADGSTGWANVTGGSGATTATYTTPNLTSTTYYRAVVTSGACDAANSTTATVTVDPASAVGAVSSNQSICTGTQPADLTIASATGTIQWQWATDAAFTTPNNIGTNSTTLPGTTIGTLTSTTYYRAVVKSGVCSAATSSTITVTVSPTSVGGTAAAAASSLCAGSSTTVSVTGFEGTIQWQQSADGSTGWATVTGGSGATTATYTTPNLTATTYYRAVVTSGACIAANSTTATVTVDPTSVGGTAAAAASSLCAGSSTTVSVTGFTGTIQWQQSSNGSTGWATVTGGSGATTATYTTPNLTATTYYRAVVTSGACASNNSTTATVTVDPTSVGGTAAAAASSLCAGSSTTVSVTGFTGTIQWQQSADGSTGWANVTGGSGATTATYTTPNLTATTHYRAVVTSGACSAANSAAATITVNPLPIVSNFSTSATSPVSQNASSTVTVTSSSLQTGTYTVTYSLSGDNSVTNETASMSFTAGTPGTGTFNTIALANTGNNTGLTISSIQNSTTNCVSAVSSDNTATIQVNAVVNTCPASTAVTPNTAQTVCVGTAANQLSATITTSGSTGTPTYKYQWYYNTTNSNTVSGATKIGSATDATYTPLTTATETGTRYYFVVGYATDNSCNQTDATQGLASNAVAVTVNAATAISTQPVAPAAVCPNGTSSMSVTATGAGTLTYQWFSNATNSNTGGTSITSATNATYTAPTATAGTTYYYVVATGTCGPVTSNAVAVVVNAATAISTQPAAPAAVCPNGTSSMSVTATGTGTLTYQWFSNATNSNTGGTSITSATNATYTAPTATAGTTYYYVVVSGSCGTATSNAVAVVVNAATAISTQPVAPAAVCPNGTSSMSVTATGAGTLTYQWFSNATNSNTGGTSINLATEDTYTAPTATAGTTYYYVVATGTCGTATSNAVAVTVNAIPAAPSGNAAQSFCSSANPTVANLAATGTSIQWYANASGGAALTETTALINGTIYHASQTVSGCESTTRFEVTATVNPIPTVNDPADQTLCNGVSTTTVNFSGAVSGTTYTWTNNNTAIGLAAGPLTGNIGSFAATNSGTSAITGTITVTPSANGCTGTAQTFTITVNPTPTVTDPADQTVCNGAATTNVNFSGAVSGTTYTWTNNNTNIGLVAGSTGDIDSFTATNSGASAITGTITVTPSANSCTGTSQNFTITVNPTITPSVTISATSTAVCAGSGAITFTANPTNGGSSPAYQWYLNGSEVGSNADIYELSTPADEDEIYVLLTSNATSCLSTTTATSSTITLTDETVEPEVSISASSTTICPGESVTFTATGTNTGSNPIYTWKVNGTAVTQANSSTFTTTALKNDDIVTVELKSDGDCLSTDEATSNEIEIKVNAATEITTQPIAVSQCSGSDAEFSVVATGTGILVYEWKKGTDNVGGNSATLSLNSISAANAGNYTVTVTSDCGIVTSESVALTVIANPEAPTGLNAQSFCDGANPTVANLAASADGTIKWYDEPSNGSLLNSTDALVTATTYYASQTVSGCESTSRLAVTATVNENPDAPTGDNTQIFCSATNPKVSDLTANGSGSVKWYAASSGGSALAGTTALAAGKYYASQTVSGCESTNRFEVTVTITNTPNAPTGNTAQAFCAVSAPTVASLTATGNDIKWYSTSSGGSALSGTAALEAGKYYASQTVSGCESTGRLEVNVTITADPNAPTGTAAQSFCAGANPTVANLAATGTDIKWYANANGGSALDLTTSLTATIYHATQTVSGCESTTRFAVTVTITATTPAPTGEEDQSFCSSTNPKVGDLIANGSGTIKWYSASTAGQLLADDTDLVDGVSYYASLTVAGCGESTDRLKVNVTVTDLATAPIASNNGPVCEGSQVTLSVNTIEGASYNWTGPNNFSSDVQNPTVTTAGVYTVSYTLNGCTSDEVATTVEYTAAPDAPTASNNGPVCEGSEVILNASDIEDATYNWTGPDGFTSDEQNPVVTAAGTYFVTATIDGCASAAAQTSVSIIGSALTPEINNDGPGCSGSPVTLSTAEVEGATYNWTGPDGFTSDEQNPEVTVAGTYTLSLAIDGCTSADVTTEVVINETPAAPIVSNSGPVCEGSEVVITASEIEDATYSWTGPDGFTSDDQILTVTVGGTYAVTVTLNGCTSEVVETKVFIIGASTEPELMVDGSLCTGSVITLSTSEITGATYSWTGPDDFESDELSFETQVEGTYTLTVSIEGCTSAEASYELMFNEIPDAPVASNNGPVCEGSEIILSATEVEGAVYNWTGPNGFASDEQNPTVTVAGTYTVTATVNGCKSAAAQTTVIIATGLDVTVSANNISCFGLTNGSVTATVNGGSGNFTYVWNTTPLQNTAVISGLLAGTYEVTVTDNVSGCKATVLATISEPTALDVDVTVTDATCSTCADGSIELTVTGGTSPYTYSWINQQGGNTATELAPGAYSVTVTDANGCTFTEVIEVGYSNAVNEFRAGFKTLNVYPNPANAVINYSATFEGKELVVLLVDVQGRIIATTAHASLNGVITSSVNTSVLNPGIYQLRFISDKGVSNKKFVVTH
jgi:autotransporter-associated beta strand protein